MKSKKPILLLEDDAVDIMTVKRAIKDINIVNKLYVASNGEEGLEILRDETTERPCIIFLDINMPKMNGIEFLRELRTDEALRDTPVVMMTTSKEEQDKLETFKLGIAGYIIKPVDYVKFVEIMKTIDFYWTLSEMPH
ncbi:MAG: response regulator [bacterium]|nr:response regulator [bacterium]